VNGDDSGRGRTLLILLGAGLVLFGVLALAGQAGVIPRWLYENWSQIRSGVGLVLVGVVVIWFARGGFKSPAAGTKLYRSREDKWLAGVLGGLAAYFGMDALALRLIFIALLALGTGWPVGVYILMAILVPLEPARPAAVPGAGHWVASNPVPPAPVAPPEVPPAPVVEAPAPPTAADVPRAVPDEPATPPEDTP